MSALPPAPATSTAVVWQPPRFALSPLSVRCEPRGSAILQRCRGWSIPHLSLRGPDSASACRPSGSTSAPSPLASTISCRFTGLPLTSSSALVVRRPAIASGLLWLLRPTDRSTWVFSRSGSSPPPWSPEPFAPPWILSIPLARWLSISALGSSPLHHSSVAVGRPPGVGGHPSSVAPPSVGSTVGHHHGCGLGPAVCHLLRVPPVSSLAPPSFVAPLDSVYRPPPGGSSSS